MTNETYQKYYKTNDNKAQEALSAYSDAYIKELKNRILKADDLRDYFDDTEDYLQYLTPLLDNYLTATLKNTLNTRKERWELFENLIKFVLGEVTSEEINKKYKFINVEERIIK